VEVCPLGDGGRAGWRRCRSLSCRLISRQMEDVCARVRALGAQNRGTD
jgi:hypothetical protein